MAQIAKDNTNHETDAAKYDRLEAKAKSAPYPKTGCDDYRTLKDLDNEFKKNTYSQDVAKDQNSKITGDEKDTNQFVDTAKGDQTDNFNKDGHVKTKEQKEDAEAKKRFPQILSEKDFLHVRSRISNFIRNSQS